jgi:alcohol dehydrogenase
VHGGPAILHLVEDIWLKNLTITTGLVDTYSTPALIGLVVGYQLDISPMITHRFALDVFETAYDVFSRPAETGALKVLLTYRDSQAGTRRRHGNLADHLSKAPRWTHFRW